MIVYGRNPVREALRGPRRVSRIWATEGAATEPGLEGAELSVVAGREVAQRCGSAEHQGICAETGDYCYAAPDSLLEEEDALVVSLDEVQDPHNLGAICRVAEASGCAGVVVPERRSAAVTPASARRPRGRGRAPGDRPRAQFADWSHRPSAAKRGSMERRPARPFPTTVPTTGGASCSS